MTKSEDQCDWKGCKKNSDIGYQKNNTEIKKLMCFEHWKKFCDMQSDDKEIEARKSIGLK